MVIRVQDALAARRNAAGDREKGFTLIELLVVVLIIGVLAAIAIPIYLGQQEQARNNAAAAQLTNAKTALVAQLVTAPSTTFTDGAFVVTGFTPATEIPVTIKGYTAPTTTAGVVSGGSFCLQAKHTGGNTSYKITESTAAAAGTC